MTSPQLSVIVTVYQKEHQIGRVVEGIVANTTTPFQLVMVYDGCTDRSEKVVQQTLARNSGMICDLKIVHTPDVNETRANNAGMRSAAGRYFILVQDDMHVLKKGWEKRLIRPMQLWPDVFGVSARNAHSFICSKPPDKVVSYSCTEEASRDVFRIRDAVNRGPLALCSETMRRLDYLDEAYAPLYFDDMDLGVRAYRDLGKVCGVYKIEWRNLRFTVGSNNDAVLSTGGLWRDSAKKNRLLFWERYHDYLLGQNHDEDRPLLMNERDDDVAELNDKALRLIQTADYTKVLQHLTQALRKDPARRETVLHIADVYRKVGMSRQADDLLKSIAPQQPDSRRTTPGFRIAPITAPSVSDTNDPQNHSSDFASTRPAAKPLHIRMLGTDYGGWAIDPDLVPAGSTVISAGVGEDISFDTELIRLRGCLVIGIDPTEKARAFAEKSAPADFRFVRRALTARSNETIRIYRNGNPKHVSESITPSHHSVLADDYYLADTIGLQDIIDQYDNISLVKMDIEGAEYDVIASLTKIEVPQICVEFHHVCTDYTIEDTMRCIDHLRRLGYSPAHVRSKAGPYHEVTFVHRKYADGNCRSEPIKTCGFAANPAPGG